MVAQLKILVVEDNDDLRLATIEALQIEGHDVIGFNCAEAVPDHLGAIEIVLVDLNLPGEDGLVLAQRVRAAQPNIGIIMVTARALSRDSKLGYESGADIYMVKPVPLEGLCAAINALSRRLQPASSDGILRLDQRRLIVSNNHGENVSLSAQEVVLLAALSQDLNFRLESWRLIELLNKDYANDPKAALELQIVRLRKKLSALSGDTSAIRSIRGWGYQLCIPLAIV